MPDKDKKPNPNSVPEQPEKSAREVFIESDDRPFKTQLGIADGDGNDYDGGDVKLTNRVGPADPPVEVEGGIMGAQGDTVPLPEPDEPNTRKIDGYFVHDLTASYEMAHGGGNFKFLRVKEVADTDWGMDVLVDKAFSNQAVAYAEGEDPETLQVKNVIKRLKAEKKNRDR